MVSGSLREAWPAPFSDKGPKRAREPRSKLLMRGCRDYRGSVLKAPDSYICVYIYVCTQTSIHMWSFDHGLHEDKMLRLSSQVQDQGWIPEVMVFEDPYVSMVF